MELGEMTISEYSLLLEQKKSVPGGGSALALVLELAADLAMMVGNFTLDKKGYESHREEIARQMEDLQRIKEETHRLIDEDGKAYRRIMESYKTGDKNEISLASIEGCDVPYRLYLFAEECRKICLRMKEIGNKNLISDAAIGSDLCKAILPGCIENIRCNISGICDEEIRGRYAVLLK